MQTKILLVLFALMLLSGAVLAQEHTVYLHSIEIQLNNEGEGTIIEKFFLNFPNEQEKIIFRNQSTSLGTDIDKWAQFDPLFKPSIGMNNQTKGRISYTEGDQTYLELSYELTESLMAKGKETAMMAEYSIKPNFFNNFFQSGLWVIPDNTKIEITLPAGAEIKDTIEPQANITVSGIKKTATWDGYKSANRITLTYVLWKKITPAIDMTAIIDWLFRTPTGLGLVVIIFVIVGAVIWKRKKIISHIESFVENNSVIEEE